MGMTCRLISLKKEWFYKPKLFAINPINILFILVKHKACLVENKLI